MVACQKILIVDDNADHRLILTRALKKNGVVHIDSVCNGEEAIRYVLNLTRETQPELIFLDLTMEGMSGLDLLRWLRQNSIFHAIPVVILTNTRSDEKQATAIALRAKAFYLKPLTLEELDALVKKALEHCEQPHAVYSLG